MTVNKLDGMDGLTALNRSPLGKIRPSVVVARKEPPIFKLEPAPNKMPLGLIKNKLALLLTLICPNIFDGLLPVTRAKMLLMLADGLN